MKKEHIFSWKDSKGESKGSLIVEDGVLFICPEDDFYNGKLDKNTTAMLASCILNNSNDNPQEIIARWVVETFGSAAMNPKERSQRFLEEALELVQAVGALDRTAAHELVDYVFDRKTGEVAQEVGGTLFTLFGLAASINVDAADSLIAELQRALSKRDEIRAKQDEKAKKGVGGSYS